MLRAVFVCAIMAVGLVGALRSRFAALQLYIWFALFRPQEWVWFDLSAYRLSTVLGALLVIPSLATGLFPVLGHPLSLGLVAFFSTALLAHPGATDPAISWDWIGFFFKLLLVCLLAIRLSNTRQRLVWLIGTVAWSFGFHPVKAGMAALGGDSGRLFEGIGGSFADNNTYAVGCVAALPLFIAFAQNVPVKWVRWATWFAVPCTMITVISTFSRGGLLALSASMLLFLLLQKRRGLLLSCVAALLPLLLFVRLPKGYSDRIATTVTYEEVGDDSALGRLHFWRVALDMAKDHPLGVGLWNFQSTYDHYDFSNGRYGTFRAVHNSHLQVLTETGWLGAACWVTLFGFAFATCLKVRKRARSLPEGDRRFAVTVANGLMASMFGFLVGGTFVSMALNEITWLTFALVASADRITAAMLVAPPAAIPEPAEPELPAYGQRWARAR